MTRLIIPVILILIAFGIFFVFTNPLYNGMSGLRAQVASYDEALNNSKALENERDKLTAKYNSINPENLIKLQKLLPDNIDNIRLILEIEQIAAPYGMVLKDVKYSTAKTETTTPSSAVIPRSVPGNLPGNLSGNVAVNKTQSKDYGVWDLEFSTTGSYNNFLNFTKDLESNLRIVDIASVQFSSSSSSSKLSESSPEESYKYNFKIKTYWLKN